MHDITNWLVHFTIDPIVHPPNLILRSFRIPTVLRRSPSFPSQWTQCFSSSPLLPCQQVSFTRPWSLKMVHNWHRKSWPEQPQREKQRIRRATVQDLKDDSESDDTYELSSSTDDDEDEDLLIPPAEVCNPTVIMVLTPNLLIYVL